jgi:HSP20 family molecular chaperone IbpA
MEALTQRSRMPLINIEEHKDFYLLTVDVPGIPLEGIEILSKPSKLTLTATNAKAESDVLLQFKTLGDRIRAIYQGGLLILVMPKQKATQDFRKAEASPTRVPGPQMQLACS